MQWSKIRSAVGAAFLASFLVLFAACGKQDSHAPSGGSDTSAVKIVAGGPDSTEAQNIAGTRDFLERVFNQGDTTAIDQYMAPTYVERTPGPGQPTDVNGFKMFIREWRKSFPDMKMTIDDIMADGDKVIVRNTVTGTNTGPFMDKPATNKSITMPGIDIIRIENGKAVEHWGQSDVMGLMAQMGMMPGGDASGGAPAGSAPSGDTAAHK